MAAGSTEELKSRAIGQLFHYLNNGAWGAATMDRGVEFKSCPHASHDINVFYGGKEFNCGVDKLVQTVWADVDEAGIKAFDPDCLQWRYKQISEDERCVYQLNKLTWPIWNRSFCTLWFKAKQGDQTIIGYTAMEDAEFPEKPKDDVRGKVSFTGMILTPIDGGKTKVDRLMHIDPAGSLPAALVNRLAGRQITDYLLYIENKCK